VYRIFNQLLESSISLPELPRVPDAEPDFSFRLKTCSPGGGNDWNHVHDWKLPDGTITISCARRGEDYVLRFPRIADFQISSRGRAITCFPESKTDETTIRHLLIDQVIPRVVGHRGKLVLHASAVAFGDGSAAAFLGDTGWGKSTLASGFQQQGACMVTDDCLVLQIFESRVSGIPAYRGLRLWPDSIAELFHGASKQSRLAQYGNKQRVKLQDGTPSTGEGPVELTALFLLSDPDDARQGDRVTIEEVSGHDALMALIACLFTIDVLDDTRVGSNFFECGKVINTRIPVYRLDYPRDHAKLATVYRAVLDRLERVPARCA